jgi:acyl-CoA hydrolase
MGFHRWRKPLLTLLEHEAYETGEMAPCRSSLERFWKKTLEVNTREFVNKTLELPEDREESVFFHHLANNTPEYQAYLAALEQEDEERKADRKAANKKDVADYARIAERERRRREQQSDRNSGRRGGGYGVIVICCACISLVLIKLLFR